MDPFKFLGSRFRRPGPTARGEVAYDFDRISAYFHRCGTEGAASLQRIDADTTFDLDLHEVFERIDRTTTPVGRQMLYARLRTLRGPDDCKAFAERTAFFEHDPERAGRCTVHLGLLAKEDAYELHRLVFDETPRLQGIPTAHVTSLLAAAALIAGCIRPVFFFLFLALFVVNLWIHYTNKIHVFGYLLTVRQFHRALRVARRLASERVPGSSAAAETIRTTTRIQRRSRIVGQQADGGDLAAAAYLFVELFKIAFCLEPLLFHRFLRSIEGHRETIHRLLRFIGETDATLAVARLRRERPTCRPEFLGDKRLEAVGVIHPLIDGCVANTLRLENESLLLTGSNMSGKTTFLRTLILNALLGETVGFCFAERFRLPYCRIFSVIGLTDDLGQGTSYYLQEVLSVKRLLEAANKYTPCLFALDEPFKGTNTAERIAAGKAVLSHLNRSGQLVLVSTHDLELAVRLRSDGFVPYHFREEIADRRLTFDYRLHPGVPAGHNALRILELYGYPPEVVAQARRISEELTGSEPPRDR